MTSLASDSSEAAGRHEGSLRSCKVSSAKYSMVLREYCFMYRLLTLFQLLGKSALQLKSSDSSALLGELPERLTDTLKRMPNSFVLYLVVRTLCIDASLILLGYFGVQFWVERLTASTP